MTRQEFTNTRDLTFSKWIRANLPNSSTGYLVTDLDFVIFNYVSKNLLLMEVKTRGSKLKYWQSELFNLLDKCLKEGIKAPYNYLGFHLISFENANFKDGKVYLDNKESSEAEIENILSLV